MKLTNPKITIRQLISTNQVLSWILDYINQHKGLKKA